MKLVAVCYGLLANNSMIIFSNEIVTWPAKCMHNYFDGESYCI